MVLKALIPAAIASLISITPASATAPASLGTQLSPLAVADVIPAASRNRHDGRRHREGRRHSHSSRRYYVPGRRYTHAPRGWRRYHTRPYYWRTRGCIVVGPIWFCP